MMVIVAVVQLTDTFPILDRLARIETAALRSGPKDISSIAVPGVVMSSTLESRRPATGSGLRSCSKILDLD
jgi:hypothetical protein